MVLQNVALFEWTLFLPRQKFSDLFILHSVVSRLLTMSLFRAVSLFKQDKLNHRSFWSL